MFCGRKPCFPFFAGYLRRACFCHCHGACSRRQGLVTFTTVKLMLVFPPGLPFIDFGSTPFEYPGLYLLFISLGHPPRILRRHVCVCFRVCVRLGRPIPSSGPSSRAQTRHTCASALCKIALRLPDPVRFDAYCFLKGLADSAALFPLVEQQQQPRQEGHGDATAAPEAEAGAGGGGGDGLLDGYRREQELLSERIENGASARAWGFNGPGFARRLVLSACPLTGGAVASMPVFVVWGGGYGEPPRFSLLAFLVRLECAARPWPLTGVHARHT